MKKTIKNLLIIIIRDVEIIVELDKKLDFINLGLTVAYQAKINPVEIWSSMKIWHGLIYNELYHQKIIVPREKHPGSKAWFEGAYVEHPQKGMHDWLVTYDYSSLYPNIMIGWNMSALSVVPHEKLTDDLKDLRKDLIGNDYHAQHDVGDNKAIKKLINNEIDTTILKKYNVSLSPNGIFFDITKQDLITNIVKRIYDKRIELQGELKQLKADKEEGKEVDKTRMSYLKNVVWSFKIIINSFYGCVGNRFFRFYNNDVAEAGNNLRTISFEKCYEKSKFIFSTML